MLHAPTWLPSACLVILLASSASGATIQARIAETVKGFKGTLGVAAKDLVTGETVLLNADLRFPTASTIKTAVMVEAYHQMAEGRFGKDRLLALTDEIKVGDSDVLGGLRGGLQLSVADLLFLMITRSDNTATNMLVGLVGTANVDKRLASYGLVDTKLFRPTFRDGRADAFPEQEREFGLGVTTPREMARLMELIATGQVVSRAACDEMIAVLGAQQHRDMIPRRLPLEQDHLLVANKTGADEEKQKDASGIRRHTRSDAAIVRGAKANYVIAIYTRNVEDRRWSVDNAALVAGADVSALVYEYFSSRR